MNHVFHFKTILSQCRSIWNFNVFYRGRYSLTPTLGDQSAFNTAQMLLFVLAALLKLLQINFEFLIGTPEPLPFQDSIQL